MNCGKIVEHFPPLALHFCPERKLANKSSFSFIKIMSGHSNLGAWLKAHSIPDDKLKAWQFFFNFNDKVSREEDKAIYSGLRTSGMALFNQG